jgi:hypothetical protein
MGIAREALQLNGLTKKSANVCSEPFEPQCALFIFLMSKGAVIIYGGGWHRREKGWVNKILSE